MTTVFAYAIALLIPALAFYVIQSLDRFKTAKTRTLIICAAWGALVAYPLAALVNGELHLLLGYQLVVLLAAPLVEEILKSLVLFYFTRQPSFTYFVDGAVYGFAVGIGFAMVENFAYVSATPSLSLAIMRVFSTALMHAITSGIVGTALGGQRRTRAPFIPVIAVAGASLLHVGYNILVNTVSGGSLLVLAAGIGIGGSLLIALQIVLGLRQEKRRFSQSLDLQRDVSTGERQAIQRLGGASLEALLHDLRQTFGEQNISLIRRLLLTQANVGILQNNLTSCNASPRLREAWEKEIALRQAESREIRRQLGRSVWDYLQVLFPAHDCDTWDYLQEQFAQQDPTLVHTFDMFMRMSELARKFTPQQLESLADRLSRIDIFSNISLADLENLSRAIETADFADGVMLFDKGDEGDAMYLIENGAIAIFALDKAGNEKYLRTFGVGQVVGDFAVLDGERRSARARAQGDLSVLVLRREVFQMFMQSRPQVILAVLAVLAERARYTTRAVETTIQTLSEIVRGEVAQDEGLVSGGDVPAAVPDYARTSEIAPVAPPSTEALSRIRLMMQAGEGVEPVP